MKTKGTTKTIILTSILVITFSILVLAYTGIPALSVVSYWQGPHANGSSISPSNPRSNPNSSLGFPDSSYNHPETFFSLGFGGWIVLKFNETVGKTLTVYETTWHAIKPYPLETADVYASKDGITWKYLGNASNKVPSPSTAPIPSKFNLSGCIKYVKIKDTTNKSLFEPGADGFDVDAVLAESKCIIVKIDIKPGSYPSCFNQNNDVIPVAIFGNISFDVTKINITSIRLDGLSIKIVNNKYLAHIEDYNKDGYNDLIVQIKNKKGAFPQGTKTATLTGNLIDDTLFEGTDKICIAPS